jgi:glyoxylase-like metal-dependent hydrolase (beta-lactamase superfamily II)
MLKTKQISKNVVKIESDANCYIVEKSIIIDTSRRELKGDLLKEIKKKIDPEKIRKVIFTHLHYDHTGCFDLFPNAQFFASPSAVQADARLRLKCILNKNIFDIFNIKLNDITKDKSLSTKFQITLTPGHCVSCLVLYYEKDNILFTGDTYFDQNSIGRVDLPSSEPEKMNLSLKKVHDLISIYDPIIAPGHDY